MRPRESSGPWTESDLEHRLGLLRIEHRDLDDAIAALASAAQADQLQLARLKRRKLRLRDEIAAVEDQLIPDIIA
ncbi:DUF465 domain-containing protein [Sphingomonas hankookensis]|uniref:DUF465 domain-containing protein n=1 Tax=Sphingomonas hankookensis TaxID=563996 RepID=UPI003D3026E3